MAEAGTLPIRRLTLYKHGIGFVQREGTLTGEEIRLVLRAAEVNDALKSLLVIDRGGGKVLGIHYETPADREARLADCPIRLEENASLLDLLRGLRGWRVRLVRGEGTQARTYEGKLLGVDLVNQQSDSPPDTARRECQPARPVARPARLASAAGSRRGYAGSDL